MRCKPGKVNKRSRITTAQYRYLIMEIWKRRRKSKDTAPL